MEKKAKIWVFVEVEGGAPSRVSLEALSKARQLGVEEAILLTEHADSVLPILEHHGARRVLLHRDRSYAEFPVLAAVNTIAWLVERHSPDLLVFGSTYYGREVAARLAARINCGVITDVVDLQIVNGTVEATTLALGGSYRVRSTLTGSRHGVVLIRPKAFDAIPEDGETEIEEICTVIPGDSKRIRVVENVASGKLGMDLEAANIVVSGGRGMKEAANFELLRRLARLLKGATGASRVAVDLGWAPYSIQVGQTGKTVKPQVYLACGISGSFQHLIGMTGSRTVIAINTDPDAQIFSVCDFGVVGDTLKVLPQLIQDLERRKESNRLD